MTDHSAMKLGRKAVKRDTRTLLLARYMTTKLPPAPPAVDWTKKVSSWGMMLNDKLGDCTIAGVGHAIQTWSANLGAEATLPDVQILQLYEEWDGYELGNPETDQGGVELDVLTKWRKSGAAGHRLDGFAALSLYDRDEPHAAIALFGGIYIGLELPLSAQTQDVWDEVPGEDGEQGSWGGHCVFVPAYDSDGFTCITWGAAKRMTNAFWDTYCDEAYALLSPDWIGAKGAPSGFNLTDLQADLARIR